MNLILAGDIGGTKTLLEVGYFSDRRWRPAFSARYASTDHPNLHSVLRRFFLDWRANRLSKDAVTHACLGVAGPMLDGRVVMTNLPWIADANAISAEFNIPHVRVVNDFFAAASGVEMLQDGDIVVLQSGEPVNTASRLVIGAGTGLGIAHLVREEGGYKVIAGEGGHTAFAPTTLEQIELWRDLYTRHARVTVEDVVSGPGLVRIYKFIECIAGSCATPVDIAPAAIVHAALNLDDPKSLRALDLFIACYGEVAGNFALAMLARGGVFVAGGIAPRIISRLQAGGFLAAFNAKGDHSDVVQKIPVHIVTNERLGLLGCALIGERWQKSVAF
jgi:glucokinase